MRQIKVLVVEDSLLFRELLIQKLNEDPAIHMHFLELDNTRYHFLSVYRMFFLRPGSRIALVIG